MEDIPGSVLAAEQVPLLVPTDVHSESHPAECSCRKIIFSAADRLALSPKRPTTSSSSPSAEPRLKIADIPITCPERLEQAAVTATTTSELTIADRKVDSSSTATTGPPVPKTYLYLAYGSNLAAETFLGRRGIRPISRINVSAPAFDLNFGLGGLPYWEPCFANVEPRRKIPEPPARPPLNPPRPPPFDPSPKPPVNPPPTPSSSSFPSAGDEGVLLPSLPPKDGPTWNKGLYGVVYEVTAEDYATIVKTEGGGASYKDVVTPCIPLPPNAHIPETPPIPELPRPFLAHTLYAPRLPVPPLEHGSDDPDGDKDRCKDRLKKYLGRLLLPLQRPLDYAQPSLRYITLLRDGARENDLPGDYQTYLADLHHYAITSRAQTVGRYLYILVWFPWLVLFMGVLSRLFADRKTGKVPHWLGVMTTVLFNAMWMSYDGVFKKWFGDGERTEVAEGGDGNGAAAGQQKWNVWSGYGRRRRSSFVLPGQGLGAARDEEKDRLLADW